MNPKERTYTAISGGIPDRVPVIPKIWLDLAAKLMQIEAIEVIQDPLLALQMMAEAGIALGIDGVRQFHIPYRKISMENSNIYHVDKNGRQLGKIDMNGGWATHFDDAGEFKLDEPEMMIHYQYWTSKEPFVKDLNDVKKICVPDKTYYEEAGCGKNQRKIIEKVGEEITLIGDCGTATLAFCVCLRGMSNTILDLIDSPELVHAIMEKGTEIAIEKGKFNIDNGLKVLRLNDSVANMSVISPEFWRQYVFPHMKDVCDELHRYDPEVKIYCHICGNIMPVVEDIIKTGIDCIGPLDPLGGFSCGQVRDITGDRVALLGGVNTLSFINCPRKEIFKEAGRCIRQAGLKGGYVLSSGCVVPRDAKEESLKALVDAANAYGIYKDGNLNFFY